MNNTARALSGFALIALVISGCSDPEAIDTSSLVHMGANEAVDTLDAMDADLTISTQPVIDLEGDSAQQWFVAAVQPNEDIFPGDDIALDLISAFDRAALLCGAGDVEDDGATLIVDMKGDDIGSGDLAYSDEECLLEKLDVPSSISEKMLATRALDGRRDGEWDGITAEWSYHPDNGLDVILTLDD